MVKIFQFRGHSFDELKKMSTEEFARLLKARERRKLLKRGMTETEKKLLEGIRKHPKEFHKTHVREMVILPEMVGVKMGVYTGGARAGDKSAKWQILEVKPEMIGHRLGEFALTCQRVKHSSPGVGATRGSKHVVMK